MKHSRFRALSTAALLGYAALILCYTVLSRPAGFYTAHVELFWSYRAWFAGDRSLGVKLLANIALFVPFGLLFSAQCRRAAVWKSLLAGLLLSCCVEALQVLLMRGQFELDDLLNNALGAALGGVCCWLLARRLRERALQGTVLALGAAAVLVGTLACLRGGRAELDYEAARYCVQVDALRVEGGSVTLRGFALRYGQEARGAALSLRSRATGRKLPLSVTYGLAREDVDAYFDCGPDYSHTGFEARGTGLRPGEEYELCAAIGWAAPLPTGIYIRDGALAYAPEAAFRAPEGAGSELEALLRGAVLRAYLPALPCWVYQRGGALYWVVGEDYPFEADGSTVIQYNVYTPQTEKLPPERLALGLDWFNRNGSFEQYELAGDFGPWRVMQRELPEEYAVSAIVTGSWSREGGWAWRVCFRPIYGRDKLDNEA